MRRLAGLLTIWSNLNGAVLCRPKTVNFFSCLGFGLCLNVRIRNSSARVDPASTWITCVTDILTAPMELTKAASNFSHQRTLNQALNLFSFTFQGNYAKTTADLCDS